jgi:LDH2 family malate/lactate/ureidoglycolate dehydrogenase
VVPGDRARATREKSWEQGVFLDDGLWDDLNRLAAESKESK